LLLQVGDLSALAIWVDDSLNRAQSPIKVSECDGEVGSSHNDPLYLEVQLTSVARDGAATAQKRPHAAFIREHNRLVEQLKSVVGLTERPDCIQPRPMVIRAAAGFRPDRGVAAVVLVNDQRSSDRVVMRLLSMI
jgi:hypothetical protein